MSKLSNAIEHGKLFIEIYDRVHAELGAGKSWDEIDNGLTSEGPRWSYVRWEAYMAQAMIHRLRAIVREKDGAGD